MRDYAEGKQDWIDAGLPIEVITSIDHLRSDVADFGADCDARCLEETG